MAETTKVKILVEYEAELPMTSKEANRIYKGCLDPEAALALDKISEIGINRVVANSNPTVKDVFV